MRYLSLTTILVVGLVSHATAKSISLTHPSQLYAAMKGASPGDEFVIGSGEWQDVEIRIAGEGSPEDPILVRAAEPGKVKLTGRSRLRLSGRHIVVRGLWFHNISDAENDMIEFRYDSKQSAHHCRVTQCAITQSVGWEGAENENRWVGIYGSHNQIDHCHITGKTNKGATLVVWLAEEMIGHHVISDNYFGPRPELGANGGETIRIGTSAHSEKDANCLVEGNIFDRCNGETECISNKSCRNTYRGNTFLEVAGTLTLRHGNDCLVEENVFLGNGARRTGGVRVIGERHRIISNWFEELEGDGFRSALVLLNGIPASPLHGYFAVRDATIEGNAFVRCQHSILIGYNDVSEASTAPHGVEFLGNFIHSLSSESAIQIVSEPSQITWERNLVAAKRLGIKEQAGITLVSDDEIEWPKRQELGPQEVGPDWW